jgi:hypothetical protein
MHEVYTAQQQHDIRARVAADITRPCHLNPERRHRTYPRAVKRARHNHYRVKKPADAGIRHDGPATVDLVNKPAPAPPAGCTCGDPGTSPRCDHCKINAVCHRPRSGPPPRGGKGSRRNAAGTATTSRNPRKPGSRPDPHPDKHSAASRPGGSTRLAPAHTRNDISAPPSPQATTRKSTRST